MISELICDMDDCPSGTTKLYIGGLDEKATSKDIGKL